MLTGRSYSDARGCRPPIISDALSGSQTMTTSATSFSSSCAAFSPASSSVQVEARLRRFSGGGLLTRPASTCKGERRGGEGGEAAQA